MRRALLAVVPVTLLALAGPARATSYRPCLDKPWERGGLTFVPPSAAGHAFCSHRGKLTVKTRDGKVLGTLDGAAWGAMHLPTFAAGKIVWYRQKEGDRYELELRVTDPATWKTDVVPVPHAAVNRFAVSGGLVAIDGYRDAKSTHPDTVHIVDLARAAVVATAHVDTLPRWPKLRFEVNYIQTRNGAGEQFFMMVPSTLDDRTNGPVILGLYRRGRFEYHELAGVDWVAPIDLVVSPKCMHAAVITGTGRFHEAPHAIWIYDLTTGAKQVVSPGTVHVGTIAFDANGDLTYGAYDRAADKDHSGTLRLASCPQAL